MREQSVLDVIEHVYAAACDPDGWPRMLEMLSETVSGAGGSLCLLSLDGFRMHLNVGVGVFGPAFQQEYPTVVERDPFLVSGRSKGLVRAGAIGLGEHLVPLRQLERSDFFNDFARHHEYIGGMTSVIAAGETSLAAISVCRRRSRLFGNDEVTLMRALMPHLQRALQVHVRLAEADARELGLREALDRLATGAILVSAAGEVLFANDSARETLAERDGLTIDRGILRAAYSHDTARLRDFIGGAVDTASRNGLGSGGVLLLERPSGRRPLQLIVSPWMPGEAVTEISAHAILFINDPERVKEPHLDLMRRVYGLSRAEGEVARLLLQDRTVQEIGDLLGVTVNTIRFHLKQLFAKTGTHRQSELVRLLLTTAQVRRL